MVPTIEPVAGSATCFASVVTLAPAFGDFPFRNPDAQKQRGRPEGGPREISGDVPERRLLWAAPA
jgi:hypothetical protein